MIDALRGQRALLFERQVLITPVTASTTFGFLSSATGTDSFITPAMGRPRAEVHSPTSAPAAVSDSMNHVHHDQQAATLRRAAAHGAPFCEECARRAEKEALSAH